MGKLKDLMQENRLSFTDFLELVAELVIEHFKNKKERKAANKASKK